jgi:hypothetical protein
MIKAWYSIIYKTTGMICSENDRKQEKNDIHIAEAKTFQLETEAIKLVLYFPEASRMAYASRKSVHCKQTNQNVLRFKEATKTQKRETQKCFENREFKKKKNYEIGNER